MKFKNGDIVIGNEKAGECYYITNKGWVGTVVNVLNDHIVVKDETTGATFMVMPECFGFLNPQKEISEEEEAEFATMIF